MKVQAKQLRMLALALCMTVCMTAGLILSGWWSVRPAFAQSEVIVPCFPTTGTAEEHLANAIESTNLAPGLDVILIQNTTPKVCFLTLSGALPTITDALIIRGDPGHVILDRNGVKVFRILHSQADLTVENVTVRDGQASGPGGGIYAEKALTLTHVNILSNEAYEGGGVYAAGPVVLTNVWTHSNKSTYQGPGGGGGIFAGSTLTAAMITVTHNTATNGTGGGIYIEGNAVISDARVSFNHKGDGYGGGLYANADLHLMSSRFYSNTGSFAGGAVYVKKVLTMEDSLFFGNNATSGGGIFIDTDGATSTIERSHFENNSGTALYSAQPIIVNTSHFTGNTSNVSGWGSGIYAVEATIDSSHFVRNHAGGKAFVSGTGAYIQRGFVRNSYFIENVSVGDSLGVGGGGLAIEIDGVVQNNIFIRNRSVRGGGLYIISYVGAAASTVSNNLFIDNEAPNGAAIITGLAHQDFSNGIVDVIHNTIVHSKRSSSMGISVAGGIATIKNNIITGYARGIVLGALGNGSSDANLFFDTVQTHHGMDAGPLDMVADPLFVDAANGDFHLQETSPGRDSGIPVSILEDIEHNPRPQGEGFDRGVYEHTPLNKAPVAVAENYTITGGSQLTVAAPGVLGNDGDEDGDALTAQVVAAPATGDFELQADGALSYRPAETFSGTVSFSYQAFDGQIASEPVTVTITVEPAPSSEPPAIVPVSVGDQYETQAGEALIVTAPGVLENDDLQGASPVAAELAVTATHGTLVLNADGSFVYMPDADFVGEDTFAYRIRVGEITSEVATVTLVVTEEAPGEDPDETPNDDPNDGDPNSDDPNDGDPNGGDPNNGDPNNQPGASHQIFFPQVTR